MTNFATTLRRSADRLPDRNAIRLDGQAPHGDTGKILKRAIAVPATDRPT
jgi:hypothetical protein